LKLAQPAENCNPAGVIDKFSQLCYTSNVRKTNERGKKSCFPLLFSQRLRDFCGEGGLAADNLLQKQQKQRDFAV
jgi:hypothetical protein